MRTVALAVFLECALACVGLPLAWGQRADASGAESKLIALEHLSKMQAWKAKDLKTLDTLLDREFIFVDPEGKLESKSELLAFVKATGSLQYTADSMVVKLHNGTAIVTGLYQIKGVTHGKPFLYKGRFVDTWLLQSGQWIAVSSLSIPSQ